jgi:uncharacterized protein (TIGR00369 family)
MSGGTISAGFPTAPALLFGTEELIGTAGDALRGRMTVDARHAGPDGRTAVGALGVLVDEVLGFSVIAGLPARSWTVSTELWIDVLAPVPTAGTLVCEGRTVEPGAFAIGEIRDADGAVVAQGRQRGRRFDVVPDFDAFPEPAIDHVRASASAGLDALLGLHPDADVVRLPVTPDLVNPIGRLHGGVSLAAAEIVATDHRVRDGCRLPTSSLHVVHTRGAPAGAELELRARTVHGGRSLRVTEVIGTVGGEVCVAAWVSAQRTSARPD